MKLYPNVKLGKGCNIGDFCIIGLPPKGKQDGELETVIGDNAVIRSHTVIYAGNRIGNNFSTGHFAMIRELNEIGDDVSIGTMANIEHHVRLEAGARVHSKAFVPEHSIIEAGAWLGPNVVITNAKFPLSAEVKERLKGAHVKRGAIIGANSTLLPGVVIGEDAVVGAGSVVTRDVEPGMVVVGSPAKAIKKRDELVYSDTQAPAYR
jgi:acetyltransferase-like isoleucine patch superfamily enzyme